MSPSLRMRSESPCVPPSFAGIHQDPRELSLRRRSQIHGELTGGPMSKQREQVMSVRILPNTTSNPPGKLADAEVVFEADAGPLTGLKLIGFAIWERRAGGRNVTFPARQYSVNGERRSFALLRPDEWRRNRAGGDSGCHPRRVQPPRGRVLIDLHGHRAAGHRPAVRRSGRPPTHADTAWVGRLVPNDSSRRLRADRATEDRHGRHRSRRHSPPRVVAPCRGGSNRPWTAHGP